MIPLRILHLVPDPLDWTAQAAEPVLAALAQDGHESAWCCPLPHQPDPGGRTCIGYHPGWWRWLLNERTAAAARAAQWTPDLLHVHALSQLNVGIDLARTLGLAVVVSVHHSAEAHSARRLRDPLVAWVLELALPDDAKVLDLGTGSGAIALAVAVERPGMPITLVPAKGSSAPKSELRARALERLV